MRKRSSNQIRNFIVCFAILMILVLVGLIVFLLTVDVKSSRSYGDGGNVTNTASEGNNVQDEINVSDYKLIEKSSDGDIEVSLVNNTVEFSVKLEDVFKRNYPDFAIDVDKSADVAVHGNVIDDVCIGRIDEKSYLFVLTDKGSIGVMDIDEAVRIDVFRIKNGLILFDKPVVRLMSVNGIESSNTVIAVTQDGKKYDLAEFVE